MNYFKYTDNEVNIGEIAYLELDEEYYCFRAVFAAQNKLWTTNFIQEIYFLPEGSWYDVLDMLEKISEKEFNNLWERALKPFIGKWNKTKNNNSTGNIVKTKFACNYPQGIILSINETFYGIADYDECKMKYGWERLYPRSEFDMKIIGYDEKNMWLELKPM